MFWILEIFPPWFWWLTSIVGVSGYFLAHLLPLKTYSLLLKIVAAVLLAATIFIFGLKHADNRWQQAAADLRQQVYEAEAKSRQVNTEILEKVVVQTRVVRQKGETVVKYIDREVVKIDERCTIPPEFVSAHNKAAAK